MKPVFLQLTRKSPLRGTEMSFQNCSDVLISSGADCSRLDRKEMQPACSHSSTFMLSPKRPGTWWSQGASHTMPLLYRVYYYYYCYFTVTLLSTGNVLAESFQSLTINKILLHFFFFLWLPCMWVYVSGEVLQPARSFS